jgi:hypothetical protein
MKKDSKLHIPKKKNSNPGFSLGRWAFIMGNSKIETADPPQFTIVE